MIEITSRDNDKIKYTKSLLKAKNRSKEGKFIIEGYRILTLALESNAEIEYVFINDEFEKKKEHREFINELESRDIRVYKTTDKNFKDMVDTENTQGILAVVPFEKKNIENDLKTEDKFIVVLDRIQDPGNMGTIIRTADAAGADAIITLKGCVDIYNPKVIRSTMGSIFSMKIISSERDEMISAMKENNINLVSSWLNTDNYYDEVDYGEKVALVIGNEANGIEDKIAENSDLLVKIPIYGSAESLNAAISSAVLMYEIKRSIIGKSRIR